MKQIFIAWTPFIQRPESMRVYFGYDLFFLPPPFDSKILKPIGYIVNSFRMASIILNNHPCVLWIQLAPVFLLYIAFIYKALLNKNIYIIADCHNGIFYPAWRRFPFLIKLLNRCNLVLIHNDKFKETALKRGISDKKIRLLETRPARIDCGKLISGSKRLNYRRPWILMPCSFDWDEPIKEVVASMRDMPNVTLIITGNISRATGNHSLKYISENVILTGFLSIDAYNLHLCQTDVILGLTTQDDIQLSVANEAVGAGKAMVISDTTLLRRLFSKGAVYVDERDPQSISEGCRIAIENKNEYAKETKRFYGEKVKRWEMQAEVVLNDIIIQHK